MDGQFRKMIISGAMKNPFNLMTKWRASNVSIQHFLKSTTTITTPSIVRVYGNKLNLLKLMGLLLTAAYSYSRIAETDETFRKADKHYIHQTFDGLTILRCEELADIALMLCPCLLLFNKRHF